ETPGSPGGRSSSTRTAEQPATAAAPSPARTPARSTAPQRTQPARPRYPSSPAGTRNGSRYSSPTLLASQSRSLSPSTRSAPETLRRPVGPSTASTSPPEASQSGSAFGTSATSRPLPTATSPTRPPRGRSRSR